MNASAPLYECSIQGALSDDHFTPMIERLRGLCNQEIPLYYREIVFKSLPLQNITPSELRVRCHLIGEPKWTLRYVGNASNQAKLNATVRNVIDVEVSNNVCTFVEYMGYKNEYEYFMRGFKFIAQKTITVTVAQIKKSDKGQPDPSTSLFGKMWLVDITCIASDEMFPQACEKITSFADLLLPFVEVAKIDHRTLVEKTVPPPSLGPGSGAPFSYQQPASPRYATGGGLPPHPPNAAGVGWSGYKKEPNPPVAKRRAPP